MEKFIEAVRGHPCLWNPQRTNDAWKIVVDEIKMKSIPNTQKAKSEWKRLRDNHRDALKRAKLGKNKLLPAQVTTWKYAKAMQFLEPYMKYRISEDIEPGNSANDTTTTFSDEHYEVSTTDSPDQHDKSPLVKRRRIHSLNITSDSLESFYDCVLKSTREMPQWMQIQVKKKIFAVIIDAEEAVNLQSQHANDRTPDDIKIEIKEEIVTD